MQTILGILFIFMSTSCWGSSEEKSCVAVLQGQVRKIPKSELGDGRRVRKIPHQIPEDWVEVAREVDEIDKMLWKKSIDKKEMKIIEVFDSEGNLLKQSQLIKGLRGEIPWNLMEPEFNSILEFILMHPTKTGLTIRMVHTHPDSGLTTLNGNLAFIIPQHLSPGDVSFAQLIRSILNKVGLNQVSLESSSVTYLNTGFFKKEWFKSTIISLPQRHPTN